MKDHVFYAEDAEGVLRRWYPPDYESLKHDRDRFGLALRVIKEGAADPQKVAADALERGCQHSNSGGRDGIHD